MNRLELVDYEQELFDSLPGPPVTAKNKTTNVWIIEWLPPNDQKTGLQLHEWMQNKRPKWSYYSKCLNKGEVLSSIERAISLAERHPFIPVLHLEAHGNEDGLGCLNENGNIESLSWDELTEPLQRLNLATRCNLIVVVAACIGFAGILALVRGPRAPAVAIVGPDAPIEVGRLFEGTKEIDRRWMDDNPNLTDIVNSASRESGSVLFDWEPFTVLAYDVLSEHLIISLRDDQQHLRKCRIRQLMLSHAFGSEEEIENKLSLLSPSFQKTLIQKMWDEMFMIDLFPENAEQFGVDWSEVVDIIIEKHLTFKFSGPKGRAAD
jgi:hypothetical protein